MIAVLLSCRQFHLRSLSTASRPRILIVPGSPEEIGHRSNPCRRGGACRCTAVRLCVAPYCRCRRYHLRPSHGRCRIWKDKQSLGLYRYHLHIPICMEGGGYGRDGCSQPGPCPGCHLGGWCCADCINSIGQAKESRIAVDTAQLRRGSLCSAAVRSCPIAGGRGA